MSDGEVENAFKEAVASFNTANNNKKSRIKSVVSRVRCKCSSCGKLKVEEERSSAFWIRI